MTRWHTNPYCDRALQPRLAPVRSRMEWPEKVPEGFGGFRRFQRLQKPNLVPQGSEDLGTAGSGKFVCNIHVVFDRVQYYSETKHRWMETTVLRIFELASSTDGNICYDLDCKKGVFADKVRSSLRASQERYEVGQSVEYWSSSGRWISAKVTKVRLELGQCDLDIKSAAPIGRLRRPVAPPVPENSADLFVRGVGDTTAATLGATLRLTGGLTRGLGQAVQTFGETQVVKTGPLAAPSRAGVYRIAAAVLTGAGNATIGLGGTVEGIASEARHSLVLSEPTRSLGLALRGQSRKPPPDPETEVEQLDSEQRQVVEQVARRLLRDAFGSPSERTVALAPPLMVALSVAWVLGRASRSGASGGSVAEHLHVESLIPEGGQSRQVSDERPPSSTGAKILRHIRRLQHHRYGCCRRRPVWLHCAGLVIVLTVVLSVDQEQQRRARLVEQGLGVYSGSTGEESVRWLNMVLAAVWTPLQKTISGLGEELATLATFTLSATEQDALSIAFENGYPYVGLVALTFTSEPEVDFSITPDGILGGAVSALPLLREALTAGLVSSLPNLEDDNYQVLVYDLGEYLAPGLFPVPPPVAWQRKLR
eukprot:Skav217581  [mRNA]  locus=scaffold129:249913:266840:- [translate_table: standard]